MIVGADRKYKATGTWRFLELSNRFRLSVFMVSAGVELWAFEVLLFIRHADSNEQINKPLYIFRVIVIGLGTKVMAKLCTADIRLS
jgi:hypothetical protein